LILPRFAVEGNAPTPTPTATLLLLSLAACTGSTTPDAGMLPPFVCTVNGVTYPVDAGDPDDDCRVCQPAVSSVAFAPRADGLQCGHGICAGGSCVADRCYVDVQLVSSGAAPGGGCFSCQPDASLSALTVLPDGTACSSGGIFCQDGGCAALCLIDAGLIPPGTTSPNGCQSCDTLNPQRWTSVEDGTACTSGGTFCVDGGCVLACELTDAGLMLGGTYLPGDPSQCCDPAVNATGPSSIFAPPSFGLSYVRLPQALASGNFNGPRGGRGLVMWDGANVTVFLNPSDAGFEPQDLGSRTSAAAPVVADFDGDSFDDIALLVDGGVHILRGQPDGGPVDGPFLAGPDGAFALAAARSRGSAVPDLALLAPGLGTDDLWIFSNDAGALGPADRRGQVDSSASRLVAGDFNGDGHYDLALGGFHGMTIVQWEPDGGFLDAGFWPALSANYDAMSAGDLDGDGTDDLVVSYQNLTNGMSTVRQFRGSGHGAVAAPDLDAGLPLGWQIDHASIVRLSSETLPGLVVLAGPDAGSEELLLQLSAGTTIDAGAVFRLFSVGGPASAVAAGDFNGDGETDLVVGLLDGGAVVLWGQCP
jgi:hypothetical protein